MTGVQTCALPILFRVGDKVRLSHVKQVFEKGYLPTWTDQVYTISQVIQTPKIERAYRGPLQYKLRDFHGVQLEGAFYGFELQKIVPPEGWRVERIIKQRKKQVGGMEYYVKWMGYGPEFNSWVDNMGRL